MNGCIYESVNDCNELNTCMNARMNERRIKYICRTDGPGRVRGSDAPHPIVYKQCVVPPLTPEVDMRGMERDGLCCAANSDFITISDCVSRERGVRLVMRAPG